jgi:hypothetical protein
MLEDGIVDGSAIGKVRTVSVGDINGDYWDDVVIGTEEGLIYYYENQRKSDGSSWVQECIDEEISGKTKVWSITIGDIDLGVTY